MRRTAAFQEMLRQLAIHLTLADIVQCVFVWRNARHVGFMLHMANGENWYVTNLKSVAPQDFNEVTPVGVFEVFKYPAPIPALNEIRPWPGDTITVEWQPRDVNDYIKEMGGADTLFLTPKEEE
jgi:hypothetical protein